MESKKKRKIVDNTENNYPSTSKRVRSAKPTIWQIISEQEGPDVLEQMGIAMIESEESSSSLIESPFINKKNGNDENLNELVAPKLDTMSRYTKDDRAKPQTSERDNDIDPNETLKPGCKVNTSGIEIYTDPKAGEIVHKKFYTTHSKGRSPLATVACNNNHTNVSQSHTSVDNSGVKRTTYIPDESFFLYRNKTPKSMGKDPFKMLSDEMILEIFRLLPKKTVVRCSYVCKRFYQLCRDDSLWARLDLGSKNLKDGALGKVLSRGVVILRLSQTEMAHPVFEPNSFENSPDFRTKLQYLDLSMAVISKPSLKMLLSKCRQLKKLSLEHVQVNADICTEIANNTNLESLNLAMCEGLEPWSIRKMFSELHELHTVNISWTSLSVEGVKAIVDNITPNLLRLNIAGCRKSMFDSHLEIVAQRCPLLLELDVSDCTVLTSAAIGMICKFPQLEYLSLSRCYSISPSAYMNLKNLKTLRFLDIFGLLSNNSLESLQETFRKVNFNRFVQSSVARPTVGTKRTSIWGMRTRD